MARLTGETGHRARHRLRARAYWVRRHLEAGIDRTWAVARHRLGPLPHVEPFDDDVRYALVTVNASTTTYLKLMLCTLAEQSHLGLVRRIVIVDNGSRDGGVGFLRALADAAPRVHVVENHMWLNHARGMRSGLRALERIDRDVPVKERANVLLFVDTDIVFRNPDALFDLASAIVGFGAVLAGEVRPQADGLHPNIQASFFAMRRDVLARRDVRPWINGGQPAFDLQWDIVRAGLRVVDFPSNHGGHILHRGRSAAAAAGAYTPRRSYGIVPTTEPHYMGVPGGAQLWGEIEARHAAGLTPEAEGELVASLARAFRRLADPNDRLQ